jgi:hypothetical protein
VKREKVREKGFLIARSPSRKKRPETTISCGPENPIHQGITTKKARDNNKLWPRKIPSTKGFPPKRPETTTSCGLEKSHPRMDSHKKICMKISRK